MISASATLALLAALSAAPAARPYDVQHYRIDLRLQNDGAFENEVRITLVPSRALTQVELDSFGLDVQAAAVEGAEIPFTLKEDAATRTGILTLRPKGALAAKRPVTVSVRYRGKASTSQEGFFVVKDPSDPALLPYYFTQLEAQFAPRFFPCNDRLEDKATSEVFAIVDGRYTVISNGARLKDEVYSEKGDNFRRVHWKQEQPHPTYAVAVAVGQFEFVEASAGVPARIWTQPLRTDRAFAAVSATEHAVPFIERYVGVKFPWAKLDQVPVPTFVHGGMENTSVVFTRESLLVLEEKNYMHGRSAIASLAAHEIAHQWFGDYVTAKSWSDIWLNEGFATFLGWKTTDAFFDNDEAEVRRATQTFDRYFREEDGPRSRPLVARSVSVEDAFDATSYVKGAHVLRMLEHWVGEEKFRAGLKAYLQKYAHGNASSEDFFATFLKATGTEKELRAFKDGWLHRRGYPVITPETFWTGAAVNVTIKQRPNHAGEKGHFVFKLPVSFHRDSSPSYAREALIVVDKPVVTARVELPAQPQWVNWNKDGVALVKVEPAAIGQQSWIAAARHDPDPVWRTLAAIVLLGEIANPDAKEQKPPSDAALDALYHVIQKDPSPYVREAVLRRIADSSWKRIPASFAGPIGEASRRPTDLPEDPLGRIRVRRAAIAALGKVDTRESRQWLFEQLMQRQPDLNYLGAFAEGVANIGDDEALATLRAAVRSARSRGYAPYRHTAAMLGALPNPIVVPAIAELFADNAGNEELARNVLAELKHNREVLNSPELASFVQDFVTKQGAHGETMKHYVLRLLDEVKSPAAKEALAAIQAGAPTASLKESAGRVLAENFPAPATKANVRPAKGKKGR